MLFGWNEGPDSFAQINLTRGAATGVGPSGLGTYGDGLSFNAAGTLYVMPEGNNGGPGEEGGTGGRRRGLAVGRTPAGRVASVRRVRGMVPLRVPRVTTTGAGRTNTEQADDGDSAPGDRATGYHGRVMADVAEGRRQERRFCLVFALLSVAFFAVLWAAGDVVVSALNRHIAWTAALVLRVLGTSAASAGAVVSAGGFAVEIKNNCNAIYEFGLFTAAVGAYPTSIGAKAAGILVGGGVLYAVNLARVVSLMALGMFARDWFEVSHLYVWQALFFATVVTCWFGWILQLRPRA